VKSKGFWFAFFLAGLLIKSGLAGENPAPTKAHPAKVMTPSERCLFLFDSSEGVSESSNPLAFEVAKAVREMGLDLHWHDIAKAGIPTAKGFRAVVTGFLDSKMQDPERFAEFVEKTVKDGVRFIIIGNYGAFQDARTERFVDAKIVNRAFNALGVSYRANWTNDPSLFEVVPKDESILPRPSLTSANIMHFYQFTKERDDVRILVEAKRKDVPSPPSAVVFASATGAQILSRYLSPEDMLKDENLFHFDLKAFLKQALAITPDDSATLLVLYDQSSAESKSALKAVETASSYAHIPLVAVKMKDVFALRFFDLENFAGVVYADDKCPKAYCGYLQDLLFAYLRNGGRVVFLMPAQNKELRELTLNLNKEVKFASGEGLQFLKGAFWGLDGLRVSETAIKPSALVAKLKPECKVLAKTSSTPVWWRCPFGKGEVIALNAYEFTERQFLGVLVQSLLDAEGFFAMPILAWKLEFVDDCPLPFADRFIEPLGKTDSAFYSNDFYGMLVDARRLYGAKFVFLPVFSYDDRVEPPFSEPFEGTTRDSVIAFAKRIMEDDHDIGLHGTNHISPALSGGVNQNFKGQDALEAWFKKAFDSCLEVFGYPPLVFVPPNNYIDKAGFEALFKEIPTIRVVSSLFAGTEVETQQDFMMDPERRGIAHIPRTWAGYFLEDEALLGFINGVMSYGVSSHFIHPDDILDPERSKGRSWQEMRSSFLDAMKTIQERFPFLRAMDIMDAYHELEMLELHGPRCIKTSKENLIVERASGVSSDFYMLVRVPAGKGRSLKVTGATVLYKDEESSRFVVRLHSRVSHYDIGGSP